MQTWAALGRSILAIRLGVVEAALGRSILAIRLGVVEAAKRSSSSDIFVE